MNVELLQMLDGLPKKVADGILTAEEAQAILRMVGQMIIDDYLEAI